MTDLLGPASFKEIREDILTDIVLEADKAGITEAVSPGTDNYVWATGMAGSLMLAHARIDGLKSAITPLNATGDDLLRWREALDLPEVTASPAAGKIVLTVTGTGSVQDGQVFTLPNGFRGNVVGTWLNVTDGDEVDAITIDKGEKANLGPGEVVRFLNPPLNVAAEATVSGTVPLTGGFDDETPARLRARELNRIRHVPGGGNWGQLRELAFNASPAVTECFVYPALGGPGSCKVVPVKGFDRERFDFSRVFPSAGIDLVRDAIHADVSTAHEVVVTSAADELTNVSLTIDIPDSTQAGGNGDGWTDLVPWPPLAGAETKIPVASISGAVVVVDADTTTAPVAGQTHVAWWSPHDMQFHTRLVVTVGGSAGAWQITPDSPFVDTAGESIAAGDYLSPAAQHLNEYGATWVSQLELLGCGENTDDGDSLPRALRHPFQSETARSGLTMFQLKELMAAHPEIIDVAYSYRSTSTPTVPGSIDTAPNVLVPNHFGIYKTP
jgi:hypothetical protein